jgi:16S rRNA G966 N2-methylase RsmD
MYHGYIYSQANIVMSPTEIPITRKLYFKLFPPGVRFNRLRLSDVSVYSITKPAMAIKIVKTLQEIVAPLKIEDLIITDAFANVGGSSLAFAKSFSHVQCCEWEPLHCDMLRHNLHVYDVDSRVTIVCGDYLTHVSKLKQDIVFLDPPWGGPAYKDQREVKLYVNGNIHIGTIIRYLLQQTATKWVVVLLPPNIDYTDFKQHITPHDTKRIYLNKKISIAIIAR